MLKRVRWMTLGAMAGVGGSLWVQHRVKQVVSSLLPDQVSVQLRRRLGRFSTELRASVDEGRQAMADRESELRGRLPEGVTALPGGGPQPRRRRAVIEAVDPRPRADRLRSGADGPGHPSGAVAPNGGGSAMAPAGGGSAVTELSVARELRHDPPVSRRRRR